MENEGSRHPRRWLPDACAPRATPAPRAGAAAWLWAWRAPAGIVARMAPAPLTSRSARPARTPSRQDQPAPGVAGAPAPAATPARHAAGLAEPAVHEALRAYVKLFRAHRAVLARVEPRLARRGLTATQLGVLEALLHKGALTQRELGRKVLTSAGNMTDVLDKLAARGLVRRVRGTADRRMVQVELSAEGRAMIDELFPRHAADIAWAMSGLAAGELAALGDLLRRLGREPDEG